MTYTVSLEPVRRNFNITVVGCGGTGGFVAEGLCRLLINSDIPILLVDYDRVEPHNLRRQNFFTEDLGKFKSQALAERLSQKFRRKIGYSVYPFMPDLTRSSSGDMLQDIAVQGLIIGCVDDSTDARREIAKALRYGTWWLDAGNGFSSGQVLLGNTRDTETMGSPFDPESLVVHRLPVPTWQVPSLLVPPADKPDTRDCAEAIVAEDQSPVINQAMATLVLEFVYRLLNKKLTWMGAYIDLDAGTLNTVPADPVLVARMLGVKVDTLLQKECSVGNRYSLRR